MIRATGGNTLESRNSMMGLGGCQRKCIMVGGNANVRVLGDRRDGICLRYGIPKRIGKVATLRFSAS